MTSIVAMVPAGSFRRSRWVEWVAWNGSHVANDDKRRNCVGLGGGAKCIVWKSLFHAKCGKRMLVCVHELVNLSWNRKRRSD